jgi:hypothetical protein
MYVCVCVYWLVIGITYQKGMLHVDALLLISTRFQIFCFLISAFRGRSVGVVRSRTQTMEFSFSFISVFLYFSLFR